MGLKPKMESPPPVDPEVEAREKESKEKLELEKRKAISSRMKGRGGTILTGGQGIEEEAKTASSALITY
tara:strand:+ start:257 stop:463 length:207 start_codon:yes stop_codon:yes gene_type:complete